MIKIMRKLYQILYNVGRLTDAPGGGRFLSRGDTLAVGFPFLGDTLAWASLRGGKALGVTKPAFPPRAPPFRARNCCALSYTLLKTTSPSFSPRTTFRPPFSTSPSVSPRLTHLHCPSGKVTLLTTSPCFQTGATKSASPTIN